MKKTTTILKVFLILLLLSSPCFGAWDNDKPADNRVWNLAAGDIRANNDALEVALGVDLVSAAGGITVVANVKSSTYGAIGDGSTDDTTAIQAALDSGLPTVYLPEGTYKVSSPLRIPARVQMVGVGGAFGLNGSIIFPDLSVDWPVAFADRGVVESQNFDWPTGFPGGSTKPDFWHGGAVISINIDCDVDPLFGSFPARVPDFGLVIWSGGEESLIERVFVDATTRSGIFIGGFPAVLTVIASSSRDNGEYGFYMANHPDADFATGISAADGGRGNGGSVRFFGPSCDNNTLAGMYADGTQIIECSGLKSETQDPAILIAGSSSSNARQRWSVTGYRHEHTGDFVSIEGTAKPQIFLGPGQCAGVTNLLNDTVNSITIPKQAEGFVLFYDRDQYFQVRSRFGTFPGSTTFKSNVAGDNADMTLSHPTEAAITTTLEARNNATEKIRRKIGTIDENLWSVDSTATGNDYKFYAYNGTAMTAVMNLANTASAPSVTIGLDALHKVGFYNTTPIVQATLSTGGGASVDDVITALQNLGLVKQ